ncbi:MAG: hypothetical protein KKA84_10510 [Bacteroidetes bacterium]|nr:hypothetical protein [Bacteroidota bacterium]
MVYSQGKLPGNLHVKSFSTANGLSQNTINDIQQDKSGLLWIATDYGLNKYDGREFKIFQTKLNDKTSIPSTYVYQIAVDSANNIWVSTDIGIASLNRKTEEFRLYQPDSSYRKDYNVNNVLGLVYDNSNNFLWAAHPGFGLYKLDLERGAYSKYDFLPDSLINDNSSKVWVLYIDSGNNLWVGTGAGAYVLNADRKLEKYYSANNLLQNHLTYREIAAFCESGDLMWIATTNGLNKLNRLTGKIYHYMYNSDPVKAIWINDLQLDSKNRLWMPTTRNGLALMDTDTEDIKIYEFNVDDAFGLTQNELLSAEVDETGIVWIGTRETGLNKIETMRKDFRSYRVDSKSKNSLSTNNIFALHKKGDIIWFGTSNAGINKLDLKTGKYSQFKYNNKDNSSINDNYIADITEDIYGDIWFGTNYGLAKKIRNSNGFIRFESDSTNKNSLSSDIVISLEADDIGNIWVGTFSGLSKYNIKSGDFTNYFSSSDANSLLSDDIISLEYYNGELWIGTMKGLCKYDISADKFIRYFQKPKEKEEFPGIYYLLHDSKKLLWMGTEHGVYIFDSKNDSLVHLTVKDGLSDNLVVSIREDQSSNIWLGTNNGLTFYNRSDKTFKIFKIQDGLPENEFNPGTIIDENGTLYFAGIGGVTYFNPDDITMEDFQPRVIISEVLIHTNDDLNAQGLNGKLTGNNFISIEPDSLFLNYDQSTLTIEYASLHFGAPELNMYEYKMEGIDEDWIHIGNINRVSYNKLAPGEYLFMVRGSNSHSVWSNVPARMFIDVYPPFWGTIIFRLSLAFLILLSVLVMHKLRTKRLRKRAEVLEAVVNERTMELREINATKDKFFSIISHDLKNPFSSLIGSSDLLLNEGDQLNEKDREILIRDIAVSSKSTYELLENLLQWSKTQQGIMEIVPEEFEIKEFVTSIIRLHTHISHKKGIELQSFIPDNLIVSADKNILTSVISNLLTNAIKFSFMGDPVKIKVSEKEDAVIFSIIDKGIGLSDEEITDLFKIDKMKTRPGTNREKGSGLGLILCKEFVEKSGGKIWAKSEEGEGSTFEFSLPKLSTS